MTKYIFVLGGVLSGVGKGVATASVGRILKEYGYSVTAVKIDPYINCDAGTMRPTEHGEVWVTEDGGEIDQDLGNYERFLEVPMSRKNNMTTGSVYQTVIERERRGDFLGEQVMLIPHITDEIKRRITNVGDGYDICLVEVGGTIGDYENIPFLFAAKGLELELGLENVAHVVVTYLPVPGHLGEMKTKPTQLAIKLLRENGIQPDFILCRGKFPLDGPRRSKIEKYANIKAENVISAPDVDVVYEVPLNFEKDRMGEKLLRRLGLGKRKIPDWGVWAQRVERIKNPSRNVDIVLVGKYLDIGNFQLKDSYISVAAALQHAGAFNDVGVNIHWVDSKKIESGEVELSGFDGILVPGGFGSSGVEGKIEAIRFARENNVPYLGLCFGMQLAVVEFARNVCGLDAHSSEIDSEIEHKVVDILDSQKDVVEKGGTMRLGGYSAKLRDDSRVEKIYSQFSKNGEWRMKNREGVVVIERHRHRYEISPEYYEALEKNGLMISGKSIDGKLAEFVELPNHKFFVATQAHPEFKSSLMKPAPLFCEFVKSCVK